MHRVVFDTVVFVRALLNPHSRAGRLVFDHSNSYHLILSEPTLVELLEVLRRDELRGLFRSLASRDPATIVQIASDAETVEIGGIPQVSRDPKDDKFLATARAGDAAYLISEDKDLLDLGEYEGTLILSVAAFLLRLESDE
jgi:putative PIN family toxin of toxin-antitoxin system